MKKLLMVLIIPLAFVNSVSANLIDATYGVGAGSFELGNFVNGTVGPGQPIPGTDYMGVVPGDGGTITGWTVGGPGNGIDWLTEPRFLAHTGIHAVDLQHTSASSISTAIQTVIGSTYELSFFAAALPNLDTSGTVIAGDLNQRFEVIPGGTTFSTQTYSGYSFLFTALAEFTSITFLGSGASTYGPVIDTVSVELFDGPAPVPVPAAVWLFGTALLGFVDVSPSLP